MHLSLKINKFWGEQLFVQKVFLDENDKVSNFMTYAIYFSIYPTLIKIQIFSI